MPFVRSHLLAVLVVVAAVAATGMVFAFFRPTYHPYVMPAPPGDGLPYATPAYSLGDARQAFASAGFRRPQPVVTSPGISGFHVGTALEVTVFGERETVDASGFSDYYTFVDGHWKLAPKSCVPGARNAERWRGNVRAIVLCSEPGARALLRRASRALTALPSR
jgi:hypothetical protein